MKRPFLYVALKIGPHGSQEAALNNEAVRQGLRSGSGASAVEPAAGAGRSLPARCLVHNPTGDLSALASVAGALAGKENGAAEDAAAMVATGQVG